MPERLPDWVGRVDRVFNRLRESSNPVADQASDDCAQADNDPAILRDLYEERAAILQFGCGIARKDAEARARRLLGLPPDYGLP